MSAKIKILIFIVITSAILVLFSVWWVRTSPKDNSFIPDPTKSSQNIISKNTLKQTNIQQTQKKGLERDPFKFGVLSTSKKKVKRTTIVLQGFFKLNGEYSAFINDKLVKKNDKIIDWTVKKITKNQVVLVKKGQKKILKAKKY
ncbi:hypothetical protein HOC37_03370 [bacterium]|jgi:hypothetical protein|nr:hypothetical protein [bacterium]MBT3581609.1 hypothetical protein [bacterium]MBT4552008.1 hypothetical protein [bacterium]MBT7087692.1 hypothetical protein [bacterium]